MGMSPLPHLLRAFVLVPEMRFADFSRFLTFERGVFFEND